MDGLINFIINNIAVRELDKEKAKEALFYIDFLMKKEGDLHKAKELSDLKMKISNRLVYLNSTLLMSLFVQ